MRMRGVSGGPVTLLAIAALSGCAGESEREVSAEANKELVRRLYEEVFNQGDLAVVDEIVGANFVDHNPEYGFPPDREGLRQITAAFDTFFPDNHLAAEDWIVEGDKVVTRVTFRGAHEGEFAGIPPTGKQVVMPGFDIHRVEGGKIVERWGLFDALGLMTQLGAISPPPGVSAVEAELRALEGERVAALVNADMDALERIHADDFELVDPANRLFTKSEYLGEVRSGAIDYRSWIPEEVEVKQYRGVAILRYESREALSARGLQVDASHRHTNVYENRDGRWQIVSSHTTITPSEES